MSKLAANPIRSVVDVPDVGVAVGVIITREVRP